MPYVFQEMYKKINRFVTELPLDVLQEAMNRHTVDTFKADTRHLLEHGNFPVRPPIEPKGKLLF